MGRKKVWGSTIGFRLPLEDDAAFRKCAEKEGITPGALAKRCALEHRPEPETVQVWCSVCSHEFDIDKTTDINKVSCPECKSKYIHYVPTLPTEPLPISDIVLIKSGLEYGCLGLRGRKKWNEEEDKKLAEACRDAVNVLNECLATGVLKDLHWCPECGVYAWDAEKLRYFDVDKVIPGVTCPLPERKANGCTNA